MAGKNDSGDKTEKPTPKKLRDARKKGEVPKSKEVTSTAGLLTWLVVGVLCAGLIARQATGLAGLAFAAAGDPSVVSMGQVGAQAGRTLLIVLGLMVVPVIVVSVLTEFLQAGPVLAPDKLKPKLEKLNPADGLKRMVSMDNLVEVVKALVKTTLIGLIGWLVVLFLLPDLMRLPLADPGSLAGAFARLLFLLFAGVFAVFVLVAAVDAAYQRHSFTKKQRMSLRDIKQEVKEAEGDPHLKAHRKQTALEQAQTSPAQAARQASVLLANPTHLAVAIHHDQEAGTVPTISGKGADAVAAEMRRAAEAAGVPTLRDVRLARALFAAGEEGDAIPEAQFDAVAQVLVWAEGLRAAQRAEADAEARPDGEGETA